MSDDQRPLTVGTIIVPPTHRHEQWMIVGVLDDGDRYVVCERSEHGEHLNVAASDIGRVSDGVAPDGWVVVVDAVLYGAIDGELIEDARPTRHQPDLEAHSE